ncbi:MAG: rhomboid family intramembrane serine protease [Muribaculaceae bacterium]|nr:rhomboid family intramembrane serine protease [Muribaculaceae bacterium]
MEATDTLRRAWVNASMPARLIGVNVAVFLMLRLAVIIGLLAGAADPLGSVLRAVELPSRPSMLLTAPWTIVTYMFSQYDVMHIIFNMLWLYWFGQVMLLRCTPGRMLVLYIYGGLAGAALFLIAYNTIPFFSGTTGMLIGSSASVMAIVTATALLLPDFRLRLLFIGDVRLKWIAAATIALVLLGVSGENAGGEVAHIGGILMGAIFALTLRRGVDITRPAAWLLTRRRAPLTNPTISNDDRRDLDAILDKIKRTGYSALTPDERKRLFEVSRGIK